MLDLDAIYRHSPVGVQNVMTTGFGLKERALRYGGRYKTFVGELDASQWWPYERLVDDQAARLRRILSFCGANVSHYRSLFRDLGLSAGDIGSVEGLAQLPMLEKDALRHDPASFTPTKRPERLVPQTTGGTTGTPLRYFVTPSALQFSYATYEVRFRRWAGVAFGQRMASINGRPIVPSGQKGGPYWRHNRAFNQLYFSAYHLSDENLPAYVARLRRFRPEVLVAYVSTAHVLARYLIANGMEGAVRPKAVLVSSETLFGWVRADIERAFGCKVFDGYGLGELAAWISECPEGSLHVSPEYGVVELVESAEGMELVATGLVNRGMPLVRYRTGDIVEPGDQSPCRCGRELPRVERILGRVDDRVVTPEGTVVGPAPMSLAFQSVANLKQAQVRQSSPDTVQVLISVTAGFGSDDEDLLVRELRTRLGPTIRLELERVGDIPRTAAGKQRLIVSEIRP